MTTQTATIQIKIDPKLKSDAIKLFDDIGLNLSDAIKLFLKQSINSSSLPFEPMVSKNLKPISPSDTVNRTLNNKI